jgi:hypothetical protein
MQSESTTELFLVLRRFWGSVREEWIAQLVIALFLELMKILLHLLF